MRSVEDMLVPEHAVLPLNGAEERLRLEGVRKVYGGGRRSPEAVALAGATLTIAKGELVVLLGPSGCGKTTLLRSVAGLATPDAGEVTIAGRLVYSAAKRVNVPVERRNVSMVFQSYALWPHMTARDNVEFPLRMRRVPSAQRAREVDALLERTGLLPYADRLPSQLSGGQQQRVALARAMVGSSSLILFDEPLSNVDALLRERLRMNIKELQRDLHFAGLYVTHDQTEAMELADRLVVMGDGHIVQVGTPEEVYSRPVSSYVAGVVGRVTRVPVTVERIEGGDEVLVKAEAGMMTAAFSHEPIPVGAEAVLLLRPEGLTIAPAGNEAEGLSCVVADRVFSGPTVEYEVDVMGSRVRVQARPDMPAMLPGDPAVLVVAGERPVLVTT